MKLHYNSLVFLICSLILSISLSQQVQSQETQPTSKLANVKTNVPNLTEDEEKQAQLWAPILKQFVHETDKPIHLYNWSKQSYIESAINRKYENSPETIKDFLIVAAQKWFYKAESSDGYVGHGLYMAIDPLVSESYGGSKSEAVLSVIEFKSHSKYYSLKDAIQSYKNSKTIYLSKLNDLSDKHNDEIRFMYCVTDRNCQNLTNVFNRTIEILNVDFLEYEWGSNYNDYYITTYDSSIFRSAFILVSTKNINFQNTNLKDFQADNTSYSKLNKARLINDKYYYKYSNDISIEDRDKSRNFLIKYFKTYLFRPHNMNQDQLNTIIEQGLSK